jgi:alkylhydroperoxidase family enzyme
MIATTLAQEIQDSAVSFDALEQDYRPMLKLVEQLIGVVPNCDPYLEIWPTGFRTYNLLVPNLLNVPATIVGGGAPKELVGLAMYTASRAAECMYCSAHTCSFALRRGVTPEALVGHYSPEEAAVARVAEGISQFPAHLPKSDITDLRKYLSEPDIEWVVLSAAVMGFLNKFMDTMGIELEESAISDVEDLISATGWKAGKHAWSAEDIDGEFYGQVDGRTLGATKRAEGEPLGYTQVPKDSLKTYLKVLRHTPAAVKKDRAWTKGVASRTGSAVVELEEQLGFAPAALAHLTHNRPIRAISTVIRDNLDSERTELGLGPKCLIALVYGKMAGNEVLVSEAIQMAERLAPEIGHRKLAAIGKFAESDMATTTIPPGLSIVEAAVVMLTKSAAPSPSEVNQITIATASSSLSHAQIVETVVWISVLQLLHRIHMFYDADGRFED